MNRKISRPFRILPKGESKIEGQCNFYHLRSPIWVTILAHLKQQMTKTDSQFQTIITHCKTLFLKKNADYGTSWRIMRLPSITDQIFIKASRIRSIQEKGSQKVDDPLEGEFVGIINYCVIALIQARMEGKSEIIDLTVKEVEKFYDSIIQETQNLLHQKNHDYSEAWRDMRISSITDIILMKIHRLKQIENNEGKTQVSEGIEANYRDMLNYSVFALILGNESGQFSIH